LTISDDFLDKSFAGDAFLTVNWNLIGRFGITRAAILAFMLSQRRRARSMGILDDAGGFHTPLKYISVKLKLSEKTVSNHIREMDFIKVMSKGMPKQNYYYINSDRVFKLIASAPEENQSQSGKNFSSKAEEITGQSGRNYRSSTEETTGQEQKKLPINNIKNNIKSKNNNNKKKPVCSSEENHITLLGKYENKHQDALLKTINEKFNLPYIPNNRKDGYSYGELIGQLSYNEIVELYTWYAEAKATGKLDKEFFSDRPVNLSSLNSYLTYIQNLKQQESKQVESKKEELKSDKRESENKEDENFNYAVRQYMSLYSISEKEAVEKLSARLRK